MFSESEIARAAEISRIHNDLSRLRAPIHTSFLDLKNENQGIVHIIEQHSDQIATQVSWVDNRLAALDQNVNVLGSNIEDRLFRLEQNLPSILENKLLGMMTTANDRTDKARPLVW